MSKLTRLLAVAMVSGAIPFAFSAVASAEPGAPNPNPNGPEHAGTACIAILTNNQATQLELHNDVDGMLGIGILEGVGSTFGCFD